MARELIRGMRLHARMPLARTLEAMTRNLMAVQIDEVDDVVGSNSVTHGLQVVYFNGKKVEEVLKLEVMVYDDVELKTPSVSATLHTATKGTIINGSGSAALEVYTDATGRFECTLANPLNTAVFVTSSGEGAGQPLLDCREVDAVAFS